MEKIINRELVYFTGEKECKIDFSGIENSLSPDERIAFLNEYQKRACVWYDDADLNQKAYSDAEVNEFLNSLEDEPETKIRREIKFNKMTAYEVYREPMYNGVHLYMGATLSGDEITLPAVDKRGTPCAHVDIKPSEDVCVSFDAYIPEEYLSTQRKYCGDGQGGRVIELRVDTVNKAKIKICNTGEVLALSNKMWAPTYTVLGTIEFGKWNKFAIKAGKTFSVSINDGAFCDELNIIAEGAVDNIFFDGGMWGRDGWKIKNIAVDGKKLEYTKNDNVNNVSKSEEKEVSLPYVIGGTNSRNRELYLVKKFNVDNFDYAELNIETLDPCGKVWINDKLVLDTKSFLAEKVCINDALKLGENEIKIMVSPRAPETYYFWHRHTDCYNGWFCGAVKIVLSSKNRILDVKVKTREVNPIFATAEISASFDGEVKLCAREIYPNKGECIELGTAKIMGGKAELSVKNDELKLWSPETPVIYAVCATLYDGEVAVDDFVIETGFRTICQKAGGVFLNDEQIMLNGALLMQFLPPFNEVPLNHNCPTDYQIAMQMISLKNMNGNFLRLHMLGYGSNDKRYARMCDRLGIMLAWTTRLIDTLEEMAWDMKWREREEFIAQISDVMNYPSIIMYEGSNEYHSRDLDTVDRMYNDFVEAINEVDDTRLLSPCSHLYYGGGIYEMGCCYFNDTGKFDQDGNPAQAGPGWTAENVVRSSHTYDLLCGYGSSWEVMRKQNWKWQDEMLNSDKTAYLITEYAITALPNPNSPEAIECPYPESYERDDELGAIDRRFKDDEWRESQALQALCAAQAIKHMRIKGVDGLAWCCLMSGANNGSYMKPPIDFYGYKKLGFYSLRDGYRDTYAAKSDINVSCGLDSEITPVILNSGRAGAYDLSVSVIDAEGNVISKKTYENVNVSDFTDAKLTSFKPDWKLSGYYTLEYELVAK